MFNFIFGRSRATPPAAYVLPLEVFQNMWRSDGPLFNMADRIVDLKRKGIWSRHKNSDHPAKKPRIVSDYKFEGSCHWDLLCDFIPGIPHMGRCDNTTRKYSDLTITCGGIRFPAHKIVVCPQSYFLESACRPGAWKEGRENVIDLPLWDLGFYDPFIVGLLLRSMYDGTPNFSLVASKVGRDDALADSILLYLLGRYWQIEENRELIHWFDLELDNVILLVFEGNNEWPPLAVDATPEEQKKYDDHDRNVLVAKHSLKKAITAIYSDDYDQDHGMHVLKERLVTSVTEPMVDYKSTALFREVIGHEPAFGLDLFLKLKLCENYGNGASLMKC